MCASIRAKRASIRLSQIRLSRRTGYGADMPVLDWRERLVCLACGSGDVDMMVSGTERR